MVKDRLPHSTGKADTGFCRKELRDNAEAQADKRQEQQYTEIQKNQVPVRNRIGIDHTSDDQRNKQIKQRFEQFEQRRENAFLSVFFQINSKILHFGSSFPFLDKL